MVRGMSYLSRVIKPSYHPRGRSVTADHKVEEILSTMVTFAVTRLEMEGPPTEVKFLPHMSRTYLSQMASDTSCLKDAEVVYVAISRILGEGQLGGEQPQRVINRNRL